ncbi:DNA-binding protein [Belnapia sp. F-4-1]|uniref:DNA-binding protein n=1 Tax=Belnapia sp. F-4-1 TaxID=1545443 RepID=UPI0005BD95C1|nr:DNA-binding protein [Belnapia sp. F-4-1]
MTTTSPISLPPLAVPLPHAPAVTGLSRSTIYREAARGNIRLIKAGRSTLVDMASMRAFLASLPTASIRAPQQAA